MNGEVRDIVGGLLLLAIGVFRRSASAELWLRHAAEHGPGLFSNDYFQFPDSVRFNHHIGGVEGQAQRAAKGPHSFPRHDRRQCDPVRIAAAPFGLIVALFGVVVMSSFADPQSHPLQTALLAAAAAVGGWLLFVVIMGLNFPVLNWPF